MGPGGFHRAVFLALWILIHEPCSRQHPLDGLDLRRRVLCCAKWLFFTLDSISAAEWDYYRYSKQRFQIHASHRLKVYLAATAVTIISAIEQARVAALKRGFSATTGDIVFWNFTALAVLIAVLELIEWRKRSSASGDRR